MAQFRFRTTAIVGEWRQTRRQACEDAIRLCIARRDPSEPDGIRWIVPTEIETDDSGHSQAFEASLSRKRA